MRTGILDTIGPQTSTTETLQALGVEAVDRLLFEPLIEQRRQAAEIMRVALGFKQANRLDNFYFALAVQAAEIAVRVGYALAHDSADIEARLRAAISNAGLDAYQPPLTLDLSA